MVYEKMSLEEVVAYLNSELLKGRSMKEIEQEDFGVNERVITKRLARKNIKKVDGQFVLQSGSKMTEVKKKQVIELVSEGENNKLVENKRLTEIEKRVFELEKIIKEIVCTQSGSKVVTNDLGLKIYSSEDKPIAKTIRLYKDIWDKIDMVKEQFPHLSYQSILNSLLDEITEKYLK
jgi:hypothetical protein